MTSTMTGRERVLRAFLAAPQHTMTNAELGDVPGVQAFHQRISDLQRRGYVLTPAVKVKGRRGLYSYRLLGVKPGSDAATEQPFAGVTLPALEGEPLRAAVERAVEDLEQREVPPRVDTPEQPDPVAQAARDASRESREALARIGGTLRLALADVNDEPDTLATMDAEALADRAAELLRKVSQQVNEILEAAEAQGRRVRAPRQPRPERGPTGPDLMRKALEAAGVPLHSRIIAERVMANGGDAVYKGKTPDATMAAQLATSNKDGGDFVKVAPGCFGLRAWPAEKLDAEPVRA